MHPLDIIVIVVYLTAVVVVGIACRGRQESVDEYFTARGMFRGVLGTFLVGLSIAATFFSGVSLVIYVSSAYSNGLQIALGILSLPVAWLVLHYWFLPRYLAGGWRHPYDVIEDRFGRSVRWTLSAMFGLMRVGWMAVLVYAPTLVIIGTANLGSDWIWPIACIIGLSSTAYTVVGGIRGVIVTDAIQFLVIAGGMVFIGGFLFFGLDLPVESIWRELASEGRLEWLNLSLDPSATFTFWAVIFGLGVTSVASYVSDQMSLQRYLASESPSAAIRAFTINILSAALVLVTLIIIGLLLWVWYRHHPDPNLPGQPDRIIPYFIAQELPPGVSGVLIAAILAATMSSMTSGINGLAGTLTNDWVARLGRSRRPEELFRIGRVSSLVVGLLATAAAGFVDRLGSLLEGSQVVTGLFLGPMLACMVLAVSGVNIRPWAMQAGLVAGVLAGGAVAVSPASGLWVSTAGFVTASGVASLVGRWWPRERPSPR